MRTTRWLLRITGACTIVLGFAVMGTALWAMLMAIVFEATCAPGDWTCSQNGPFAFVMAVPVFGFGLFSAGVGALLWQAAVHGLVNVAADAATVVRTGWHRARTWPR